MSGEEVIERTLKIVENKNSKKYKNILVLSGCLVLLVFGLLITRMIKYEITISDLESTIHQKLENVSSELDYLANNQMGILKSYTVEFEEWDLKNNTITYKVMFEPKNFSFNMKFELVAESNGQRYYGEVMFVDEGVMGGYITVELSDKIDIYVHNLGNEAEYQYIQSMYNEYTNSFLGNSHGFSMLRKREDLEEQELKIWASDYVSISKETSEVVGSSTKESSNGFYDVDLYIEKIELNFYLDGDPIKIPYNIKYKPDNDFNTIVNYDFYYYLDYELKKELDGKTIEVEIVYTDNYGREMSYWYSKTKYIHRT